MIKTFLVSSLLFLLSSSVFAMNTILVVGDSLSAGYGITPEAGWVKLLEARLEEESYPYQVINASISGDTLSNGLQRLPKALIEYHPKITIIELGANDGLRGFPLTQIKKNLLALIQLAEEAKSKVLILGVRLPPNYGAAYTEQFQQIYQDLADDSNIAVVPLFLDKVDGDKSLMQADGLHPTEKAQMIMLENVWPALKKMMSN